jgi:pimeloyl-ACP methyl ester carboxylesterase
MLAEHGTARLHFDRTGDGPPVLLVMGLGLPGDAWWRTIKVLAGSFEVISFDNRGSGRSDQPTGPLSIADMAADAVAVLDAAGIARAHVYGISMGGMIAQELALRHPDRLGALVLGATTARGRAGTPPDAATLAFLGRRAAMPIDEGRWASVPYVYSERTCVEGGDRISTDFAHRRTYAFHPDGYRAQLAACLAHDTVSRLGSIAAPVLVLHGKEDRMVPPANGQALAAAIPGAELMLLDDAAHMYTTDAPGADVAVREFLAR